MSKNKSKNILSWQYILLLFTGSLLLAWFLVPIVDVLSNKIITPFTDLLPYENSIIVFLVSLSVCLACLTTIIFFIKTVRHHIFSWKTSLFGFGIGISIVLVWIYYRFMSQSWRFLALFNTDVAIVDVFILTLLLVLGTMALYNVYESTKCNTTDSEDRQEDSMQADRPIDKDEDDKLRRAPFADKLITKIDNLDTSKGARSLAITASWGNGKTSFLNLVKNRLNKDKFYIVDITPWNLNPNKSITSHFFEEIIKKFGGIDNQISRCLKEYSDMLESVHLSFFSNLFSNISLSSMAEKISDIMVMKGIKVVIVFDDIDRLAASEIEEVFRIIRGSANFKNFIFISAFDKRYVQQALQDSNAAFNEHYIEKFFEMEFPLPEIRTDLIESIILENTKWMSEKDRIEFEKYITHGASWLGDTAPYSPLTNLRIIYRWLNSLKYKYEILREECVIEDLADLELLNLLYPQVFTLLASEYKTYFECENYQNTYKLWNETMRVSSDSDWIKHLKQKRKRCLLQDCEVDLKMSKTQIQGLQSILERLLPNHRYHAEAKGFSNPNYTQRYFDSILAQTDIPQSKFDEMIAGKEQYMEFIDNDKEQVFSHSLFLMCYESKPTNLTELRNLLEIIFYASSRYDRFGVSYYTIREKLFSFNLSKKEKKKIFMDLIGQNKFSNVVFMSFIPSPHSERQGWREIFEEEECNQILSTLFDKAVEEGFPISKLSSLYYYSKEREGKEDIDLNYICKIDKIKSNYKAILALYSISNPSYLIYTKRPDGNTYYPSTDFVQLWGDWASLSSYIQEQSQLNTITFVPGEEWNEFETFIKEWESKSRQPIPFEFKYITMA